LPFRDGPLEDGEIDINLAEIIIKKREREMELAL
jgi:hypothetical protein